MIVQGDKIVKFTGTNHGRIDAPDFQSVRGYIHDIHQFIDKSNLKPIKDLRNMGFIRGDDGQLYDLYHLPEGFKIKNLDLSYMSNIYLPKSFKCENLYAFGSKWIDMTKFDSDKSYHIKNLYATDADCVSYFSPHWRSDYVQNIVYKLDDLREHPQAFKVYSSYQSAIGNAKFLDLGDGFCAYELYTDESIKNETTPINEALRRSATMLKSKNLTCVVQKISTSEKTHRLKSWQWEIPKILSLQRVYEQSIAICGMPNMLIFPSF